MQSERQKWIFANIQQIVENNTSAENDLKFEWAAAIFVSILDYEQSFSLFNVGSIYWSN